MSTSKKAEVFLHFADLEHSGELCYGGKTSVMKTCFKSGGLSVVLHAMILQVSGFEALHSVRAICQINSDLICILNSTRQTCVLNFELKSKSASYRQFKLQVDQIIDNG